MVRMRRGYACLEGHRARVRSTCARLHTTCTHVYGDISVVDRERCAQLTDPHGELASGGRTAQRHLIRAQGRCTSGQRDITRARRLRIVCTGRCHSCAKTPPRLHSEMRGMRRAMRTPHSDISGVHGDSSAVHKALNTAAQNSLSRAHGHGPPARKHHRRAQEHLRRVMVHISRASCESTAGIGLRPSASRASTPSRASTRLAVRTSRRALSRRAAWNRPRIPLQPPGD
jgi:hypothetical protein